MKIKQKKKNSSKAPLIVILVVIVLLIVGGYFAWTKWLGGDANNDDKDSSIIENDDNNDDATDKNNDANSDENNPSQTPEQNWTPDDDDDAPQDLGVTVTYKNVADGVLTLRVQIGKYLSGGSCTLEIGAFSETVDVNVGPQTASCQGFNVPTSKFSGNDFVITVESGGETGSVKGVIK